MSKNENMKTRKNRIITWVLIPLAFVVTFLSGYMINYLVQGKNGRVANEIIHIIEKSGYVYDKTTGEFKTVTAKEVGDALVNGILDDYAEYYTAEEYAKIERERLGKFVGVGVSFYDSDNVIDSVVGNSPAYHAGIKTGDKIVSVKISDQPSAIVNNHREFGDVVAIADGQLLSIELERKGETLTVELRAESYVASYVEYYDNEKHGVFITQDGGLKLVETTDGIGELPSDTAYISFSSFNGSAHSQLGKVLNFMKERGKTKLVLDLRNNGGGSMDILCHVASYFIDNNGKEKSVVAYEKNKTSKVAHSTDANRFKSNITSLSIMANGCTASASECLIGALASYNEIFNLNKLVIDKTYNGVETTFGKGIMQTTYTLLSGGALKLTTAKVLWPNGECIHDKGISPLNRAENVVTQENALSRAIAVLG